MTVKTMVVVDSREHWILLEEEGTRTAHEDDMVSLGVSLKPGICEMEKLSRCRDVAGGLPGDMRISRSCVVEGGERSRERSGGRRIYVC